MTLQKFIRTTLIACCLCLSSSYAADATTSISLSCLPLEKLRDSQLKVAGFYNHDHVMWTIWNKSSTGQKITQEQFDDVLKYALENQKYYVEVRARMSNGSGHDAIPMITCILDGTLAAAPPENNPTEAPVEATPTTQDLGKLTIVGVADFNSRSGCRINGAPVPFMPALTCTAQDKSKCVIECDNSK